MRMLDLFSGIGGFALSAKWVWGDDLDLVGFCEIDDYCHKILNKNFPGVPIYEDIKELDGKKFKKIDLITGGFPCQDISVAGRGAGLEGTRSGLWFELLRIIRDIRPRYAIIENVPMLSIRGGTRVIADLAEIGMDAEWQIISASEMGAWHLRKRIWIVAYPQSKRHRGGNSEERGITKREILKDKQGWSKMGSETEGCDQSRRRKKDILADSDSRLRRRGRTVQQSREDQERKLHPKKEREESYDIRSKTVRRSTVPGKARDLSDSDSRRLEGSGEEQGRTRDVVRGSGKGSQGEVSDSDSTRRRERRSTESVQETFNSSECDSQRLPSDYWSTEPNVGRVANGIPNRVDRLKGLGNAIVPQCVYPIMIRLKELMQNLNQ